jgi:predicted alpha/beta hydrolase
MVVGVNGGAAETGAGRVVELKAPDGIVLKATYFAAGKPGPGVLLLHQCNRQRKVWDGLAGRLAATGINVLTMDFRGFGESGGTPFDKMPPEEINKSIQEKWPGDVDTAFHYLMAQPGVSHRIAGGGGASCGVNQAVQLARRHPEVKSLMLLSEGTDARIAEWWRLWSGCTRYRQIPGASWNITRWEDTAWRCSRRTKTWKG